jgi:hypothetical protein
VSIFTNRYANRHNRLLRTSYKAESWLAVTCRANMIRFIYKYLFIKPQGMQAKASTIVG